jgi:hypothetical protein
MVQRALARGVAAALRAAVTGAAAAIAVTGVAGAEQTPRPSTPPMILNLLNQPIESQEQAFNAAIKAEAQAPAPPEVEQWEPQPDGSMKHKKSGVSIVVRNPCPPGDLEHEFALAAYNRAHARKSRR